MKIYPILLGLFLSTALHAVESHVPDEAEMERLRQGEVLVQDANTRESGGSARVWLFSRSAPEALWEIISSCKYAYQFAEDLQYCEALSSTSDRIEMHQVVKKLWFLPAYDYRVELLAERHKRLDFRLLDGNLDVLEGRWIFNQTDDGTLVDYQVRIKPSMPAPRFLVRRGMHREMPDTMACIRGLAAGSGSIEEQQKDLSRCRGSEAIQ